MDLHTQILTLNVEIRKEAGQAKSYAVQLQGKDLSTELQTQMESHSRYMYAVAKRLDELCRQGEVDLDKFGPYITRVNTAMDWYKLRKVSVQGLLRPFQPKAAPKAKAKAAEPASPAASAASA